MPSVDAKRFNRLIEPHLDALYGAAFRLARHTADAEDLVQDTCLRAYRHLGELDESRPVMVWLRTVMHNVFVDGARRARRSPVTAAGDDAELAGHACPSPNPEESALLTQREEELQRAWSKLDRGHQALLALRAEGHSLPEIAAITALPIEALESRLYRARSNFARHLEEERVPPVAIKKEMSQ